MNWKLYCLLTLSGSSLALTACSVGDDDDSVRADDDDDVVGIDGLECSAAGLDIDGDGSDDTLCVLQGTYLDDLHLTADFFYLLRGGVFVGDDASATSLTIDPGVTLFGETSTDGMLVVRRNAKIFANGQSDNPVVFTSSASPGQRARGDWGGVIINGKAPINACDQDGEADCEAFGEGGTGWYGGDDPNDDSGVLNFVRIEFAGTLVSPDNELNGLALQGVGAGTEIDGIQVHMNADDGIEFFGGTATAKHLVLSGVGDDCLDWTDGWQGKVQFVVAQQWADNGDNGIEADNSGENNDLEPRSAPTISHVTLVGVDGGANSDVGILLREGTAGDLSNVVVTGFADACLAVDHDATHAQADAGALTLTHSVLDCATPFAAGDFDVQAWFEGQTGNETGDPGLVDAANTTTPDFSATAGGAAAMGGAAPADPFFDDVAFRGAVGPNDNWLAGWTAFPPN